jgi:hypothetical protein
MRAKRAVLQMMRSGPLHLNAIGRTVRRTHNIRQRGRLPGHTNSYLEEADSHLGTWETNGPDCEDQAEVEFSTARTGVQ